MKPSVPSLLLWATRIGALLFMVFISFFALDVFTEGRSFGETLIALLLHLIPSAIMLVAIVVAWKRAWVGALFFLGWSLWYVAAFRGQFSFSVYLLMAGLPLALGLLFLLNWRLHARREDVL